MEGYNVVLADPPWKYKDSVKSRRNGDGTYTRPEGYRSTDHYPSMTLDEMAGIPVRSMCADECVLYMWTTGPNLDVAIELGRRWGFEYKQVAFVWDKVNPVCGNYTITQCEFVLVFRPKRGRLPKRGKTNARQHFSEKKRQHSRKPEYVQDMLDAMYPDASKMEMFARRSREGWDVWGNETDKFDQEGEKE